MATANKSQTKNLIIFLLIAFAIWHFFLRKRLSALLTPAGSGAAGEDMGATEEASSGDSPIMGGGGGIISSDGSDSTTPTAGGTTPAGSPADTLPAGGGGTLISEPSTPTGGGGGMATGTAVPTGIGAPPFAPPAGIVDEPDEWGGGSSASFTGDFESLNGKFK